MSSIIKKPVFQLQVGDRFYQAGCWWKIDRIEKPASSSGEINTPPPNWGLQVSSDNESGSQKRFYLHSCKLVEVKLQ